MKTFKAATLILALFAFTFSHSTVKAGGKEKVVIQTSAICESCKNRLEKALEDQDGVRSASLNLDDKKVTIVYNPAKISLDQLKQTIAGTGYDADDVKATTETVKKLPGCCQPGGSKGCGHH